MARKTLNELIAKVEEAISTAQTWYDENSKAADVMNVTSRTSWSSAGDRVYSDGQKQISKENLDVLKKLSEEISNASDDAPTLIQAPCFVEFSQGENVIKAFLVENVANIQGYKLISVGSPLGMQLIGRKSGDSFEFKSGDNIQIVDIG